MAAPTFVASYAVASWTTSGSPKTATPTTAAGDFLVVVGISEDSTVTLGTPTGNGLTYTLRRSDATASHVWVGLWTATDNTGGAGWTMSITPSSSTRNWGFIVLRFSGSGGVGATAVGLGSGAPSQALMTTQANSAVVYGSGDWAAVTNTTRTWRTINGITPTSGNGGERASAFLTGAYTMYAGFWSDAGGAGAVTTGLSAPVGQTWSAVVAEVLGTVAGAGRAGGSTLVARAGPARAPAPVPSITRPWPVTPLQPSAQPAGPRIASAGIWRQPAARALLARPTADPAAAPVGPVPLPDVARVIVVPSAPAVPVLARSTADPPAAPAVLPVILVTLAPPRPCLAAAPFVEVPLVETPGPVPVPAPTLAATGRSPLVAPPPALTRSTTDPTATPVPPAAPQAPGAGRQPLTAPAAVTIRVTADPAVTSDTPPVLVVTRVATWPPLSAPGPLVVQVRDVTPLQPSASPPVPTVALVGRWPMAAPRALVTYSTADPALSASPPVAVVSLVQLPPARPVTALTAGSTFTAPDQTLPPALVARAGTLPPPAAPAVVVQSPGQPAAADGLRRLLVVPALRAMAGAALAFLRRSSFDPVTPPIVRPGRATGGTRRGAAADAGLTSGAGAESGARRPIAADLGSTRSASAGAGKRRGAVADTGTTGAKGAGPGVRRPTGAQTSRRAGAGATAGAHGGSKADLDEHDGPSATGGARRPPTAEGGG